MTAIARPMHYPVFSRYESIAFARYRVDKAGVVRVILQRLADFADGGVDAVFGVDEDILAPETVDDFLAGDAATLPLQKTDQQLHGDALEGNALAFLGASLATQLEAGAIELKLSEFVLRLRHTAAKLRPQTIALLGATWVRAFGVNRLGLQVSSPNLYLAVLVLFGHPRQDAAPGEKKFSSSELFKQKLQGDDL
jgi:hypothetical protein